MTRSDLKLFQVRPSLIEAHRADRADATDIQRAYLRVTWARRKTPPRLPAVRWLLAGMAIGIGIASAATLVQQPSPRSVDQSEHAESTGSTKTKRHAIGRSARARAGEAEPVLAEPPPAASEPPAASFARPAHSAPIFTQQRSPVPPSARATDNVTDWQRAAAALRSGDLAAAEAALSKLERSDSLSDLQAAELARAQLLVDRGQIAEATPTLQRLARDGSSAVVRSQAVSMLQTLAR